MKHFYCGHSVNHIVEQPDQEMWEVVSEFFHFWHDSLPRESVRPNYLSRCVTFHRGQPCFRFLSNCLWNCWHCCFPGLNPSLFGPRCLGVWLFQLPPSGLVFLALGNRTVFSGALCSPDGEGGVLPLLASAGMISPRGSCRPSLWKMMSHCLEGRSLRANLYTLMLLRCPQNSFALPLDQPPLIIEVTSGESEWTVGFSSKGSGFFI